MDVGVTHRAVFNAADSYNADFCESYAAIKRQKYRPLLGNGTDRVSFVPLILATTDRIGFEGMRFLKAASNRITAARGTEVKDELQRGLDALNVALAQGNARCLANH